jgi:RNA polymerase sigma-70 factor (ECF subfamily)
MRSEQASHLLRCLQGLQRMQRLCVYLAFVEGLSQPDVAARLQVPLGSAKAWIRRGLMNLRRCV